MVRAVSRGRFSGEPGFRAQDSVFCCCLRSLKRVRYQVLGRHWFDCCRQNFDLTLHENFGLSDNEIFELQIHQDFYLAIHENFALRDYLGGGFIGFLR